MMGEHPSLPFLNSRREKIIPEKTFVKEYENMHPDNLFAIALQCFQKISFFKVWKSNAITRQIDMTTYGTSTMKDGYREQVDVCIIGENANDSAVVIKVTPSMEPGVVGWLAWYNHRAVKEKTADLIAKIIFGELDGRTGGADSLRLI
jgi:hypothetical protein